MKHDDDSGALGTYEEDVADALAVACLAIGALCLVGLGFVAGWMVWA